MFRIIRRIIKAKYVKANICLLNPSEKLAGKKIIVTGGSKGLGYAMTKKFVTEGAEVLITGRDKVSLQKVSEELCCKYLVLDVRNIDAFDLFIEKAYSILGGVDCLVNNAGISLHEDGFSEVTPKSFDDQINTNLKGAFFLSQKYILEQTRKGNAGNILFVSSETGQTADIRPYGWTKAGVNSMTQGLAYELVTENIRVNAIAPGITASEMTGLRKEGNIYNPANIVNRTYLPEEIAEVACFLLSDASACISGQIIYCNNGKTINYLWKK